jgi:hypothetical protein
MLRISVKVGVGGLQPLINKTKKIIANVNDLLSTNTPPDK